MRKTKWFYWNALLLSVLAVILMSSEGRASDKQCEAMTVEKLPIGKEKSALEAHHFPDRLHSFIWRNWESVSLERMAEVLGTSAENISEIGQSMGLPPHVQPSSDYLQRGYISIIRRNWHLLNYEQLLTLLDWDAERLSFTLQEDDFLFIKLGNLKPVCSELRYVQQDEAAKKRCAEIKAIVSSYFGDEFAKPSQKRFGFVRKISAVDKKKTVTQVSTKSDEQIRFLYSYFGVYGDPLLNPELDPYPDGLLEKLSELGINGVWLHSVLRQLAPSSIFGEFGDNYEKRLVNLREMVNRAKRYGIKIYLYMNEPRAMPELFFKGREHMRGIHRGKQYALCTSVPEVRQWITESLSYVFKNVPDLGGVFTITASENLTNCHSKWDASGCQRCSKRPAAEVIAEVNRAIATGVWQGNPNANVIIWDWGWADKWVETIIKALPDDVYLMSVSEWSKPIVRGGISSKVGEYSMSAVGPGPRAQWHWSLAKKRGLKTIAKVQFNCSWELSAVPYLPVMNLVAEHCHNLTKAGIDGLMLSWTVGGSPSPNLQLAKQFSEQPTLTVQKALKELATARYGADATVGVLDSWSKFSTAFTEYPFHIGYVYRGPTQYGPANLLYTEPTGYSATMVGFPYDHVDGWRAVYPAEVLAGQFEKMAAGWKKGLDVFENAIGKTKTTVQNKNVLDDFRIAEVCYLHFKSVANQIRFTLARNALLSKSVSPAEKENHVAAIKKMVIDEIQIAKRLFVLTREDSRIGFEASNHYYYFPLDLVEKVINCEYILNNWLLRQSDRKPATNIKNETEAKTSTERLSVVAPSVKVEKLSGGFRFTEGPAVDAEGNIFFTDIPNNRIHKWSLGGELSIFRENSGGANGLFFDKTGNLIACEGNNKRLVSINNKGKVTVLADKYNNKPFNKPNDLWIDPKGGVYFSDPAYSTELTQDGEHVYYLTADHKEVIRVIDDMVRPNGIIGTFDGKTLYIADRSADKTYVYTINDDGTLSNKKLFAPEGADGMTIDNKGNIYITKIGISVYNSSGEKIETIDVPEQPSNVCFGGKDKQTLFITARKSLYSVRTRVKGL